MTMTINAAAVRRARLARGWSQYRLAMAAGVHPQTVSGYERGISVRPETAAKLATALGLCTGAASQAVGG